MLCNKKNTLKLIIPCHLCDLFYSLPWNQKTPIGYIVEVWYDVFLGVVYYTGNGAIMLLFISLCLFHRAFYNMYSHYLLQLNRTDKNRNNKEFLCDLIRFQNLVKR